MKITILGSTGMLGNVVEDYFINNTDYTVFTSYNKKEKSNSFYFNALDEQSFDNIPECDYVINCIGVIKPLVKKDNLISTIKTNSLFPHILAKKCIDKEQRLIHITTDCVFSGKSGNYNENSIHDAEDDYGKSKSLGEPLNAMTLRTSIIGPEKHDFISLISWAQSQKGKEVNGFLNHLWNGVTTKQYANICHQIMQQHIFGLGLFHVFSSLPVNKYELLQSINNRYNLDLKINPINAPIPIDRTLSTVKNLNSKIIKPSIQDQISSI